MRNSICAAKLFFLFSFLKVIILILANFFQNSGLISFKMQVAPKNVTFPPFVTFCIEDEQIWL